MSGGGVGYGGGMSGQKSPTGLVILPRLGTTDLHLVADDWSGSGNWTDRSAAGNHAVIVNTPTRASSAAFLGRYAITCPSTAGFHAPGDVLTAATKRTYEILISNWGTGTSQEVLSRQDAASPTQRYQVLFKNSTTAFGSALFNSANTLYLGGSNSGLSLSSRAVIIHITIDMTITTMRIYANGVVTFTDTTVSGTLATPGALDLGIGGIWNQGTSTLTTTPFNGSFLEILRHAEVMDATTIAMRSAQFNALKGY
jgi:hypothetical protein